MKNVWKVLGIAALAVGLTPYKVEKDEETGENKYQALLWQATRSPKAEDGEKGEISVTLGFNPPAKKAEEAHLFSDDLSVEYATVPVTAEAQAPAADAAAEEEAAEEEAPAEAAAEEPADAAEEAADGEAPAAEETEETSQP